MDTNFKTLIGVAFDKTQAQNALDKQIESLKKNAKLALDIELSDKQAKKVVQDTSKAWSNYRKEAVAAITAPNTELAKMKQFYVDQEKEIQKQISSQKRLYLETEKAYKLNEKYNQNLVNLDFDKVKTNNQITTYLNENSRLTDNFVSRLKAMQSELADVDESGLKRIRKEFATLKSEATAVGVTGKSALSNFVGDLKNFTTFLSAGTLIMGGINTIRNMISSVKELDAALVDLQMATGGTYKETKELLSTYIDLGQQMGATATEVSSAASDYLRQGKSIAETNELIKDSLVLSKIGNLEAADATTYLTTAMKGYQVATEDVIGIVDKLSAVDMVSATDAGGLAAGMAEVANNARLAGVEMDKLLGYLAVIGETTGESMSSVGVGLNAIFSRMGNIKLSRLKDYQNNGDDLSNVETVLRGLGVQLRDSTNSFRNFGEVLDEVAENWSTYDEVSQRALASAFSGTNHMEEFLVLMENYGTALDYSTVAMDSSGTAMEKFSTYQDSVEAKTNALTASLQELASTTVNSDWVKGFLDLSNVLVQATNSAGGLIPVLTSVGVTVGVTKIAMDALLLSTEKKTLANLAATVSEYGLATSITATGAAIKSFMLTNPVGWVLMLGTAVFSVTKIYDAFTTTLEEQQEKLSKVNKSYEDSKTKLESINSELETTNQRIDELAAKDNLTFVEQDELEKLKGITAELLLQKDIAEDLEKSSRQDLANETVKTFNKQFTGGFTQDDSNSYLPDENDINANVSILASDKSNIASIVAYYNQVKKIKELMSNDASLTDNEKVEEQERLNEELDSTSLLLKQNVQDLLDYKDKLEQVPIEERTNDQVRALSDIGNAIELIYTNIDSAKWKDIKFTEAFNSSDFEEQKVKLEELAKAGKLDESVLTSNAEYADLMEETGMSASELVTQIKALNTVVDDSSTSVANNKLNWEDSAESIGNFQSSISKINDALTDLNNLTPDDILKLMKEFPQLAQHGFTGSEGINALKNALMDVSKEMYNSLDVTVRENALIKALIQNLNDLAYSFNADKIVSELESIEVVLNKVRNKQSLSADEIVILTTKYKDLAGAVEKTADGYSIEESALASLISKKSEDANIAIVGQINQTNTVIEQIKSRIEAYKAEANALDELARKYNNSVTGIGDWIEKYGEGSAYDTFGASRVIEYQNTVEDASFILDRQLSKLDALKSSLNQVNTINKNSGSSSIKKSNTKEKSTKDVIKEIDWIKPRFDAVERSVSKLNDAYSNADTDNQVEALEKLISKQEKLTGIYKNGAKEYRNQYESNLETIKKLGFDADEIFNKIKWGANSIDIFKDLKIDSDKTGIQEQLYNEIQSAITYWNNYSSAIDKKVKVEYEIKDNKKELNELYRTIGLSGIENSLSDLQEVNDELSTMATLLGDVTVYDEFGKLTANGAAKITILNSQLKNAEQSVSLYKDQIKILNEQYLEGLWTSDEYYEKLKDINSEYRSAISDVNSYKQQIISLVVDGINAETDAYKDQVSKIIEVLENKKKLEDNNKSLLEKQKKLAILQKQINALSLDESNRENNAQRLKLEQEYAKLKEEIDDEVADNAHQTTVDSLESQADAFEKAQNQKISELKNSLAQQEYAITNSLDIVSGKYESVYKNLVDLASSYGIQISNALTNPLENAMNSISTTGTSGNSNVSGSVYNVLTKNTTGEKQTAETGLNQYLISKGYNKLSWDGMFQLANALGMTDVKLSDIKNSGYTRGQILNKLKASGFSKGGLIKATGEDGVLLGRANEYILTEKQVPYLETISNNLPTLSYLTQQANLKTSTPEFVNGNTENMSTIKIEKLLTIEGNSYDESTLDKVESMLVKKVPTVLNDYLTKRKR